MSNAQAVTFEHDRFDHDGGKITIHCKRPINTRFRRKDNTYPETYILDASASEVLLGCIFPEIQGIASLSVRRNAYVIQCHSTRCPTTSLTPERNTNEKAAKDAAKRLRDIEHLVRRYAEGGQRVLVVGPTAVVGNPKKGVKPLVSIPAHCAFAHFNNLVGIDAFKDFDVAVVIGRNQPPIEAAENIARALYASDPKPLLLTGAWSYETRGYRIAGEKIGVEVPVHPDPRVQAVVEQMRERESEQAVDRLRLIHSTKIKTIILLSNTPLDIDVDELRTWDEIIYGSRLEQAWDRVDGVLPLNPEWLAAKFGDLWKTDGAAKKDVGRGRKRGQTPNIISIRNVSLFEHEYGLARQRRWSRCLSRFDDPVVVAAALMALLGEQVTIRSRT